MAYNDEGKMDATVMNYTPVLVAAVLIIAFIYWWLPKPFGARHFYVGPKKKEVPVVKEEEKELDDK